MERNSRGGFTLIELLIFIAIFSTVIVGFITILTTLTSVQSRQSSAAAAMEQSQSVLQQIQYYIEGSRMVDMTADTATGTLRLRSFGPSQDPINIMLASNTIYIQQGVNSSTAITSNKVTVSNLTFTRHFNLNSSSSAYGTDSVSFSFTMAASTTNPTQRYTQNFESSADVLAPIGKIALIQHAQTDNNNTNVSSIAATFPANNESSSLLIAVVGNLSSTASVAVSDSAGNTWTKVANVPYAAYNEELSVFDAVNSKNSSNTVTATLGAGAGYPTLMLYEYRGASTSSSFDASSSALNANTKTPSSGTASPTSTVELVLGVSYNGATTEVPSAGSGFTLESSSTVAHVFTEDQNEYITAPISAGWQYSATTPSSSALVVTFK